MLTPATASAIVPGTDSPTATAADVRQGSRGEVQRIPRKSQVSATT